MTKRVFFSKNLAQRLLVMIIFLFSFIGTISDVFADVVINVVAVNAANASREKNVRFSLPGEIKREDILSTDGLDIAYDVTESGFYVHGKVLLAPKQTKKYQVRLRDIWKVPEEKIQQIQDQIDEGYNSLSADQPQENRDALRNHLLDELDKILDLQNNAATVEERIDAYRTYLGKISEIEKESLAIDYWKSNPKTQKEDKILNFNIELSNEGDKPDKVKSKHYLPEEIKLEHVVNREGFEVRYDDDKQQPFLFKEEDLEAGEKKKYSIGIKDVWNIDLEDLEYLKQRAEEASLNLANSRFSDSAKILHDQIIKTIEEIKEDQEKSSGSFEDHVDSYRRNKQRVEDVEDTVENLEKLLAKYRENLEVSKIKNVMQKIRSLRSLQKVSRAIFDKKPRVNAAWKIIGIVLAFLGSFTIFHFITWFVRSAKEKKLEEHRAQEEEESLKKQEQE